MKIKLILGFIMCFVSTGLSAEILWNMTRTNFEQCHTDFSFGLDNTHLEDGTISYFDNDYEDWSIKITNPPGYYVNGFAEEGKVIADCKHPFLLQEGDYILRFSMEDVIDTDKITSGVINPIVMVTIGNETDSEGFVMEDVTTGDGLPTIYEIPFSLDAGVYYDQIKVEFLTIGSHGNDLFVKELSIEQALLVEEPDPIIEDPAPEPTEPPPAEEELEPALAPGDSGDRSGYIITGTRGGGSMGYLLTLLIPLLKLKK